MEACKNTYYTLGAWLGLEIINVDKVLSWTLDITIVQ